MYKIVVHMVSSQDSVDHNVSSDKSQQKVNPQSNISLLHGIHDTKIHLSEPEEPRNMPSIVAKNEGKDSDADACSLQENREERPHSLTPEKHLQSSDTLSRELPLLQSGQDSSSIIREKVSKDGYNWRKYGQKHVKGNEFIRSYYKCTHPNCEAKKQLQQSLNGHITDYICISEHNHPKPQLNTIPPIDCVLPVVKQEPQKPYLANVEDNSSVDHGFMRQKIKPLRSIPTSKVPKVDELKAAHLQLTEKDGVHNNEDPESKRQKKGNSNINITGVGMPTCESRVVVQTSSEVDFVNDGFRWRKYGQKMVKGNTNPRSYYRCSNPGCPVKKHVERASHDSKIVITTYEGQHDHEIPLGRSVTHNAATNTHTMGSKRKPATKSGGNNAAVETKDGSCLDSKSRLDEKLNEETITKPKADDMTKIQATSQCNENHESKLSEQEQQNEESNTKDDSVSNAMICHSSSKVPCSSNEHVKDEVKSTPEGTKDCLNVVVGHDAPSSISEFNEQSISDAEPVQS